MPLFDRQALLDDVPRREVLAWASYDFANSGYTTVVLTAVFNAYFVGVIAAHLAYPTLAWTLALAASSALAFFCCRPSACMPTSTRARSRRWPSSPSAAWQARPRWR